MDASRGHLFVGGGWRRPQTDEPIVVINPATEEVAGYSPRAGTNDVDAAVSAARAALRDPAWAGLDASERAAVIRRFGAELARRRRTTAALVTSENGMPTSTSKLVEGYGPAETLAYYADLCEHTPREETRQRHGRDGVTLVQRQPVGVVAAIVPWNFPQTLAMFKVAPALAAGCTVVVKPSPETSLDAFQMADAALAAGLPPGVLNILPADKEIGEYLVAHPGIDKVAFTGSTAAGRAIGETCGRLLRPVTLELGGKSAAIVLDDVDPDVLAANLLQSSMLNNGQTCYLSTRILLPTRRYDELLGVVADTVSSLRVGDPTDPSTQIGPVVTRLQRDRIERYIESGRSEGRVVAGGGRPKGQDVGWFVEPTVIADLKPSASVAREEIFGPVLAVLPYDQEHDAVTLANSSEFGLGGTVWSRDADRAASIARQMETGSVGFNGFDLDLGAPFGGTKDSGLGRELGPEGLEAYISLKSIYLA